MIDPRRFRLISATVEGAVHAEVLPSGSDQSHGRLFDGQHIHSWNNDYQEMSDRIHVALKLPVGDYPRLPDHCCVSTEDGTLDFWVEAEDDDTLQFFFIMASDVYQWVLSSGQSTIDSLLHTALGI